MEKSMSYEKQFDKHLAGFIEGIQKLQNEQSGDYYLPIEQSQGKKFIRLISVTKNGSRSVYCFVDKTNGDILKGSWKAPVKNGVRGNIFEPDFGLSKCDW